MLTLSGAVQGGSKNVYQRGGGRRRTALGPGSPPNAYLIWYQCIIQCNAYLLSMYIKVCPLYQLCSHWMLADKPLKIWPLNFWWLWMKLVKKVQQNFLLLVMLSLTCNTSSSDDGLSLKTLSRYPANLWDIQTVSLILRKRLFNNSSKRWVLSKSIFEGKAGLFLLKYEKKIKFYNLRWM